MSAARMSNVESDTMSNFESSVECADRSNLEPNAFVLSSLEQIAPHSLLATARIRTRSGRGEFEELRMLCDTGAQVNLLSDTAFRRLKFPRGASRVSVVGVGGTSVVTMGQIAIDMWHHTQDKVLATETFTIVEGLNTIQPIRSFFPIVFSHIKSDELADPKFNVSAPIDGIIGVNVLSQHMHARTRLAPFDLMTQDTSFGWIVFGGREPLNSVDMVTTMTVTTAQDIYSMVKRLWEVDEMQDAPIKSAEEIDCEALYESTLVRKEGRYSVTLLLKPDAELGHSRTTAQRRLHCLEKRFQRDPELQTQYVKFMREYEQLGHMQRAEPLKPTVMHYYIPHHAVAIDRKFRVVFDASAKTTNGQSLNEVQYVGPRLQRDLTDILMTFRTGRFAMSADIAKMFRQIQVQPAHWDLQRILWRESTRDPITEYWLTVVTYGMASSPYNAVKTLNQCAHDHGQRYPDAARAILNDFYVDDLLTTTETASEAMQLKEQMMDLLKLGGFKLTKWCSNLADVIDEEIEAKLVTETDSTSVLGIVWNYRTDEFQFKVQSRTQPEELTKRIVTSEAARIFDPQGYVAPITVRAKMFIQQLWRVKKGWDDPMPRQLQDEWRAFCTEVKDIEQFRIPRWVGTTATTPNQVHIFCDASARAYGAAAYIRTQLDGQWTARLLCARSKVAQLKELNIPRLELCAMELGSKLLARIQQMRVFRESPAYLWTDSEIVLHWLRKPSNELKVFVANRVSKILRIIKPDQSRHVRSEENPADLLSRGTHVATLQDRPLWWSGPEMLTQKAESWPVWQPSHDTRTMEIVGSEVKRPALRFDNVLLTTIVSGGMDVDLIERWTSYRKTCRITTYVLRFCHLAYRKLAEDGPRKRKPTTYWLTKYNENEWRTASTKIIECDTEHDWKPVRDKSIERHPEQFCIRLPSLVEMRVALKYWAMLSQRTSFPEEIEAVSKMKPVDRKSALFMLTPQMDDDQLLRICGRLGNTNLPYEVKHPIILSRRSTLARLLAEEAHQVLCHGGVQLCTQFLRNKYWIVGVRILLRTLVQRCVVCTRYRQRTEQQFMADLPARRLDAAPAFEYTGVDYAGPLPLKLTRNTSTKGWIAVFICMRYKAVHLELVSGLDTASFLAALQRFVNLRGGCVKHMHSDRGTNFLGAARELREANEAWQNHQVMEYLVTHAIEWHHITPFAPHHGGAWESMVKLVKTHLKKMAGAHLFTYEELATLLTKISAVINSRPLTPLSNDPSDLTALTPSHFISTRPIVSPIEPPLADIPFNRLTAWQRIAKLQQEFSNRWRQECFSEMQRRNKWAGVYRALRIGDLVLIRTDNAPACDWPMGRVIEVFPGPDGRIRSCKIQTKRTTLERPITKLCLLPVDHDEADTPDEEETPDTEETSDAGFCP